jgi:hypothetical protein
MSDPSNPQRCGPTEDVPHLVVTLRELARAREQRLNDLAQVVTKATVGAGVALLGANAPAPITLAPAGASQAEQYAHYERILTSRGFTVDRSAPTVLALRGMNADGATHDTTSVSRYDDTMVVLSRDAQGNPQVTTLAGSTHPGQSTAQVGGSVGVPDVDKNGAADVGMLDAGEYKLVRRADHNGAEAWDVRTLANSGVVPGARDFDQDGKYSAVERGVSNALWLTMTGVMIHQGAANVPQSAGCLNLSSNSTVYPEFVKALGDSKESRKLVVLDANRQ